MNQNETLLQWQSDCLRAEAAVEDLDRKMQWLRWGLEEIGRCTEPKAGSGEKLYYNIVNEALAGAGISMNAAGIQKPSSRQREIA